MNHTTSTAFDQAVPKWNAPRLVSLTAAGASDGGPAKNLTEGKFVTIPNYGKFEGNNSFAVGSG